MKVLKFGGSSLATADRIKSVFEIVKASSRNNSVVVVVSALGGATDDLVSISADAVDGQENYTEHLQIFSDRHLTLTKQLVPDSAAVALSNDILRMLGELRDVLHGIFLVRERTPRTLDYVMSFGERLSARIIATAFAEFGLSCEFLDARSVIRTDDHFGSARVDFQITNDQIMDRCCESKVIYVVTGFIASSDAGETTTLGRSGSDFTAAIFAAALDSESLEIWTDVSGMMSADPRKVKKTFTVDEMTYQEAMELSHFGAKVVFPSTMKPVLNKSIPILIKNTFDPGHPGTRISKDANLRHLMIKGISSINDISMINVQGSGLVGVVGVSKRLFEALASVKINVILISQASSEHSICFAVESRFQKQACKAIENEFRYEIINSDMDIPVVENDLSIVAIIGEKMKHNPGTSGRMFSALGRNGINVYAIAQGSSELNISAVINQADISKALNVLHEAFFLSDRKVVNVFLAGTGLIGKSLIQMIGEHAGDLATKNRLEINLVGISNSRKMFFNTEGLDLPTVIERMASDGIDANTETFFDQMHKLNLSDSIFVDCTSSDEVTDYYEHVLGKNISIVTPNKKANSGALLKYNKLKTIARERNNKFLFETNVGAGLPVISTLNDLLLSGDKIISIEAVLSGTMNYIFSNFTVGKNFSEVVKEAKAKGFTEPDPRDDLSGVDVARKILILARESGFGLELSDVRVQNLVPENCQGDLRNDEFFDRLSQHDGYFHDRLLEADQSNERLRYSAQLIDGKASVSLLSVDSQHPFYNLSGSDNVILLTTERYNERPMVIRGPGAGAEVTAAGVFADIIRIGNYIQ